MEEQKRHSGFETMRILSMVMIVLMHGIGHGGLCLLAYLAASAAGLFNRMLALQDVFPLQLRHGSEHGQHKFSGGRGSVDGFLLADKFHAFCGQLFYQLQQIACVPGKPTI